MKSFSQSHCGGVDEKNKPILEEFKTLYQFPSENHEYLSKILECYQKQMLTCIENNIRQHYFDYLYRYINSYFKELYKVELQDTDFKKQFYGDLKVLKKDIKENTLNSDSKFHSWIQQQREYIIPSISNVDVCYEYDIKHNPQKYLKYMIYMNIELEKLGRKMFQFLPLQTNSVPKHIEIDTTAIKQQQLNNFLFTKMCIHIMLKKAKIIYGTSILILIKN